MIDVYSKKLLPYLTINNMNPKSILIPLAAFAVTVTGASAFNSEVLDRAGLSSEEKSAFEEARDLREEGDRVGAREVLIDAGIDKEVMQKVHEAMHEYRHEHHEALEEAMDNNDYNAFKEAIADTPLADIITTEEDFKLFAEAHTLREEGEFAEAKAIMDDLGFENKGPGAFGHGHMGMKWGHAFNDLSDEDKEALKEAREADDTEAMKEILENAGIEWQPRGHRGFGSM